MTQIATGRAPSSTTIETGMATVLELVRLNRLFFVALTNR